MFWRKHIRSLSAVAVFVMLAFSNVHAAQAEDTLYGALYESARLTTDEGFNKESVLLYYPSEDGFIAITTNQANPEGGAEWWTSDALGLNWQKTEVNPLEDYNCQQPGRHTPTLFNGEMYFAGDCEAGATIFKVTGLASVEVVYVKPGEAQDGNYPTGTVLNDELYMFFDGGFTQCDTDLNCSDVTDATNQPEGVPLEVSTEQDGVIYVAQTTGEVQIFDGSQYTTIGDGYLEGLEPGSNSNLPAIEVFNGDVYVGNQDFTNGASIFKYETDDGTWSTLLDLEAENTIVNKMELAQIDGNEYLVFYTSNGKEGTNVLAIDESGNTLELVNSGLGGDNPEINREVVSVVSRTVTDRGAERDIMLFGTQVTDIENTIQTGIYILDLGEDLAYSASEKNITSAPNVQSVKISSFQAAAETSLDTAQGEKFTLRIPKKKLKKGDVFILYVDGKAVMKKKVTQKKALTLSYKKARELASGESFTVQVGRRLSYGKGEDRILSRNKVKGELMTVTVQE